MSDDRNDEEEFPRRELSRPPYPRKVRTNRWPKGEKAFDPADIPVDVAGYVDRSRAAADSETQSTGETSGSHGSSSSNDSSGGGGE